MAGLRDNFDVNVATGGVPGIVDRATAAGMGSLRRGWETGRIGAELNPLRTEELDADIRGDEAKRQALRTQIEALSKRQAMYAPEVGRVEDIDGIGSGLSWAAGQVGQGAASMADPLAVSAGLGTVGRIASYLPGPGKALGYAAQGAGMLIPAMMSKQQLTGEFIGEAEQDPELMARTSKQGLRDMAGNYGMAAAIPDSFVPGMIGRQISGLTRAGSQVARQGLMGAGAKTALGMGMEGGTEALQSAGSQFARGQLNPDRDTSDDFMENVNSFAGGAIGSGPLTGMGALAEAGHNRIDGGVDAVKGATGSVIDTFNESPVVQAGKEKAGKLFGAGKDKIIDILADQDGEVSVGGVVGKASDQLAKYRRSADELDLLANDTPPVGLDEAKTATWFEQNDAKRNAYVQSKLTEMADDPEAQAVLQAGDLDAGAEFLLARHDLTQLKAKFAGRTQRLAEDAGSAAAALGKGAFGIAKDVFKGVKDGLSKKNMQTEQGDPYQQWQERMGFPNAVGGNTLAEDAMDSVTSPEAQSRRRALMFGNKLASAAKVAGQAELASAMQDVGFQIADMSRGWANLDKATQDKDTGGMRLAIGEIGNDLRSVFGPQAAAVIGEMERISDPEHAGLFQLLKEEAVKSGTPEGRMLREQLRSTAADKLLMLLPKAHYDEATKTPNGKMQLLAQIEQLASGGYPKGVREEVEKTYGRSRLNAMFNIVGGVTNDIEQGVLDDDLSGRSDRVRDSDDLSVNETDGLVEKDALKAMEKSRENDIYGFGGNLDLRNRKDHKDVFGHTSKITTADRADGTESRRPQLFRGSADTEGNIVGKDMWDKPGQSGENRLQAQIDLMKAKVGSTHKIETGPNGEKVESGNTNGWDVGAKSAHEVMNEQKYDAESRISLYRDYLRQDAKNEDHTPEERAAANKKAMSVGATVTEMRQRKGKPIKTQSTWMDDENAKAHRGVSRGDNDWTQEDTAAWQKQLARAKANGFDGDDTASIADLNAFEEKKLLADAKEYFSNHHVVVARSHDITNEQKLGADVVLGMKANGKKVASAVKLDAHQAGVDGGSQASDRVHSDANLLYFPVQKLDKKGKPAVNSKGEPVTEDIPIKASDLVKWAKTVNASNGQTQDVKEASGSDAKRNREYLEHLLAGVQAFVGEGHALGLPYKLNPGGEQERFDDGIPQSLRLDNAEYGEALTQKGFRLTSKSGLGLEAQGVENTGVRQPVAVGPAIPRARRDAAERAADASLPKGERALRAAQRADRARKDDLTEGDDNQYDVALESGKHDDFFTAEQLEEREPQLERDSQGADVRQHPLSNTEMAIFRSLPQDRTPEAGEIRFAFIEALKTVHGDEWAKSFDLLGVNGAQTVDRSRRASTESTTKTSDGGVVVRTGKRLDDRSGTVMPAPKARGDLSPDMKEAEAGYGPTPLNFTKGQDPKAAWDENSDLAYRTDVMNDEFKPPTNAMKAMSSAKRNAEGLTAMFMNDPREGDRMAVTMLRTALKPEKGVKGKSFDAYRIAPLVHLISENREEVGKGEYQNKTNAELFEQRGATPGLINVLRRGAMQVLIREMESKKSDMAEAHILKLARQLPGIPANVNSFTVVKALQAELGRIGGQVTQEDMATNWGDPSQRKVQPKMSPPPVVAAPKQTIAERRQATKMADAERMAEDTAGLVTGDEIDNMVIAPTAPVKAVGGANRVVDDEAVRQARNRMQAQGVLPGKGEGAYEAKDRAKAERANKFIGRGSEASSTNKYAKEWGDKANTGVYSKSDMVFISAEGDRQGRITPDTAEIKRATSAGATIITDVKADRERAYNVGERRVAYILADAGYVESAPGTWTPGNTKPAPGVANAGLPKAQSGGVKRNAQSGKASPADLAAQQKAMDAAKAWLDKVLPGTVLKFVDETGWSGEYIEAQNLINISKTAAAGIMGTVYHEGLHKFFGQLIKGNPKLLAKLNGFVNDPKVMARLIELLEGYPAAQDQLIDGEERLAYAFQFWKAGLLQVDATPQNFFQSVGALFRRILGHMRDSEHAQAIFEAFDSGKLANPSTAGKVIAQQLSKGTGALATRRRLDKFVQGLAAATLPTEMILGESVSPTARKLGKILFTNPGDEKSGGGQLGYLNAKRARGAAFDNRAKQLVENLSTTDMNLVQEYLQRETPFDQITVKEIRAAVEGTRVLLDEFHKYMVAGGVKLGKVKNYYPTVWNVDQLIQNKDKFIKMLVNNYAQQMTPNGGNAHKAAERIHASLVNRQGVDDALIATREDGVLSPFFAAQEGRTLPWLSGEHKAEFLEKNMTGALQKYFHQGARATEYNRRFGEHGVQLERMLKSVRSELEGASKAMMAREEFKDDAARKVWVARQVRDVSMSVGAIEGTLGKDISPNMRKFNSWMTVYQNIRLLPMALFSSFVDPMAQVARGAPMQAAFETFMHGIKSVYQAWAAAFKDMPPERIKSEWESLAEHIGATEVAAFQHHVSEEYSSVYMSPAAKKINDFMFRFNGMEAWDRSNRIMATKWAVRFIEKHAALPDKSHSARWLAELGLKAGSIPLNADGELVTNKEELAVMKGLNAGEAARQMEVIHNALNRWVEGAVITPNSAQRPAWSSDPNYSVFFHLKQFSYSFQQTIMKRAVNEIQHGNLAPVGALAMFIPTMITSDIIKGLIQGGGSLPPYMAGYSAGDWMIHGLSRSGLAGVGDIGMSAGHDMASLGGPAVEQGIDMMRDDAGKSLMKALPMHSLYEYLIGGSTKAAAIT